MNRMFAVASTLFLAKVVDLQKVAWLGVVQVLGVVIET